jgi:hypothetical protein
MSELPEKVKKALVEAVGLTRFNTGWHTMETGRTSIGSIWVVEINIGLYHSPPVYIAGIHQVIFPKEPGPILFDKGWYKGVLLVPPVDEPLDRAFGGTNPLPAVDLEFPGPIYPLLKNANLLREIDEPILEMISMPRPQFIMHIYARGSTSFYLCDARQMDKYQQELWKGIHQTFKEIRQAYNDAEIEKYFGKG